MEGASMENREGLKYEAALALAEGDPEGWERAQVIALEGCLLRASELQPDTAKKSMIQNRISERPTLQELFQLGEKQKLLADFDLEREALKVYCNQRDIKLSVEF
jgi:hypothetical protein